MNIIAYLFSHLALTEVHSFRRRNGVSCVTSVVSKHSVEFKIPKANQHVDRHKLSNENNASIYIATIHIPMERTQHGCSAVITADKFEFTVLAP